MGFTLFLTQQLKMTKENRERTYAHFRDLEKNYVAREGLNAGPTATSVVRKNSKESADAILKQHPELSKIKSKEKKPMAEEEEEEEAEEKSEE